MADLLFGGAVLQYDVLNMVEKINSQYFQLHVDLVKIWNEYMLFTWRWWLGLVVLIAPAIVWLIYRKKEITYSLLVAGLFMACTSFLLDNAGMALGLWSYPSKVVPIVPPYLPWDFSLLPVATMFFIQWESKFNVFVKSIIFSFVGSFIAQPFFEYCGLYYSKHWKHYYSFPIFILMYLIASRLFSSAEKEKHK